MALIVAVCWGITDMALTEFVAWTLLIGAVGIPVTTSGAWLELACDGPFPRGIQTAYLPFVAPLTGSKPIEYGFSAPRY